MQPRPLRPHMLSDDGRVVWIPTKDHTGEFVKNTGLPVSPPAPDGSIIWHYTKEAAAQAILKEGILRATWYGSLDDPAEFEFGHEVLLEAKKSIPTGQYELRKRRWINHMLSTENLTEVKEHAAYVLRGSLTDTVHYLRRKYATPGRIIGMPSGDGNRLVVLDPTGATGNSEFNYKDWREVIYDHDEQLEFAKNIVRFLIQVYPDDQAAWAALFYYLPYIKRPEFAKEEEVRFVAFSNTLVPPSCEHVIGKWRYVELTYGGLSHVTVDIRNPQIPEWTKVVTVAAPLPVARMRKCWAGGVILNP